VTGSGALQVGCDQCEGLGFVYLEVPVGHRLYGKAIECECTRRAKARRWADRMRDESGLDGRQIAAMSFERFDVDGCVADEAGRVQMGRALMVCRQYADRPEGWLILAGPYGSGKTHLALAIAGHLLARASAVYMASVPELLAMLRRGYDKGAAMAYDRVIGALKEVELLVLDDLGAERDTDWAREQVYEIVDHRYRRRLPMVVTTNLSLGQMGRALDGRIVSRLLDGARVAGGFSRYLALAAGDYRRREG